MTHMEGFMTLQEEYIGHYEGNYDLPDGVVTL